MPDVFDQYVSRSSQPKRPPHDPGKNAGSGGGDEFDRFVSDRIAVAPDPFDAYVTARTAVAEPPPPPSGGVELLTAKLPVSSGIADAVPPPATVMPLPVAPAPAFDRPLAKAPAWSGAGTFADPNPRPVPEPTTLPRRAGWLTQQELREQALQKALGPNYRPPPPTPTPQVEGRRDPLREAERVIQADPQFLRKIEAVSRRTRGQATEDDLALIRQMEFEKRNPRGASAQEQLEADTEAVRSRIPQWDRYPDHLKLALVNEHRAIRGRTPAPFLLTDGQSERGVWRIPLASTVGEKLLREVYGAGFELAAGRHPMPAGVKSTLRRWRDEVIADLRAARGPVVSKDDVSTLESLADVVYDVDRLLPFLGQVSDIVRGVDDHQIVNRIESGQASEEEKWELLRRQIEDRRGKSFGAGVLDIVSHIPAFMAEFRLTGGLLNPWTKGVATTLIKRGLPSLAARIGSVALTSGPRTLMLPGRIAEYAVRHTMDQLGLDDDDRNGLSAFLVDQGDNWTKAVREGVLDTYIENLSEMSGGMFGRLPLASKVAAIKSMAVRAMVDRFPVLANVRQAWGAAMRKLREGAIHGVGQEWMEERVGAALRALPGIDLGKWSDVIPGGEQALQELAAFTVFPAFGAAAKMTMDKRAELTEKLARAQRLEQAKAVRALREQLRAAGAGETPPSQETADAQGTGTATQESGGEEGTPWPTGGPLRVRDAEANRLEAAPRPPDVGPEQPAASATEQAGRTSG